MEKMCFLFGHADAREMILPDLQDAIEQEIVNGIAVFCVGTHGKFDSLAATALKAAKKRHTEIVLLQLVTYLPEKKPMNIYDGFDGTYYPPVEGSLRKYALVRANQHMTKTADSLICYVWHHGNTKNLLSFAQKKKKDGCRIINVAENGVKQE